MSFGPIALGLALMCGCATLAGLGGLTQSGSEDGGSGASSDGGSRANDDAVDDGPDASGPGHEDETGTGDGGTDDGSALHDSIAADAPTDAAAICREQCSGCCDPSGTCHGGRSADTCGSGGEACHDCTTSGQACSNAGVCVVPSAIDSGPPPMCVVTECTNTCPLLPLVEAPCCKSDQTCGCGAVLGILLCN